MTNIILTALIAIAALAFIGTMVWADVRAQKRFDEQMAESDRQLRAFLENELAKRKAKSKDKS